MKAIIPSLVLMLIIVSAMAVASQSYRDRLDTLLDERSERVWEQQ